MAGLSKRTLERIESNEQGSSVTLWHLVNLACVLGCELYTVVEDEWLTYRHVNVSVPPPARTRLSRPEDEPPPPMRRERARRRPVTG
jgi:hypothetical protein